ncbi:MAG: hypothetical protein KC619_25010 [Myxococcales bacterium]|nr:hypothetical protein [Myxococcales bacterium]
MNEKKKSGGKTALIVVVVLVVLSVPCCGGIAAIAIPSFIGYLTRAKTEEARTNLTSMFIAASAYYAEEQWGAGGAGAAQTNCAVGTARTDNVPSAAKTMLGPMPEAFEAIGFSLYDPVYYQYEIVGAGGCGHQTGEAIYSFRAYGDLDGDGVTSLYELTATAGPAGELVRSPIIRTEQELE